MGVRRRQNRHPVNKHPQRRPMRPRAQHSSNRLRASPALTRPRAQHSKSCACAYGAGFAAGWPLRFRMLMRGLCAATTAAQSPVTQRGSSWLRALPALRLRLWRRICGRLAATLPYAHARTLRRHHGGTKSGDPARQQLAAGTARPARQQLAAGTARDFSNKITGNLRADVI